MDFAVPVYHWVKLEKGEKRDKYQDLGRELKKLWKKKMTEIPNVIGALGTVTKRLVQGHEDLEIRGRVKTIQTTALKTALTHRYDSKNTLKKARRKTDYSHQ